MLTHLDSKAVTVEDISNMEAAAKKVQIQKMWRFHACPQHGSSEDLHNHHSDHIHGNVRYGHNLPFC